VDGTLVRWELQATKVNDAFAHGRHFLSENRVENFRLVENLDVRLWNYVDYAFTNLVEAKGIHPSRNLCCLCNLMGNLLACLQILNLSFPLLGSKSGWAILISCLLNRVELERQDVFRCRGCLNTFQVGLAHYAWNLGVSFHQQWHSFGEVIRRNLRLNLI
jgi:hypothetical protein